MLTSAPMHQEMASTKLNPREADVNSYTCFPGNSNEHNSELFLAPRVPSHITHRYGTIKQFWMINNLFMQANGWITWYSWYLCKILLKISLYGKRKVYPQTTAFYTTKFSNYHPDRIRDLCGQSCHIDSMPYWRNLGSREQCAQACCSCNRMGLMLLTQGTLEQCGLSCCSCSMMAHLDFVGSPEQCVLLRCSGSTYPGPPYILVQNGQSGYTYSTFADLHGGHILHHLSLLQDILVQNDQSDCTCSIHLNSLCYSEIKISPRTLLNLFVVHAFLSV